MKKLIALTIGFIVGSVVAGAGLAALVFLGSMLAGLAEKYGSFVAVLVLFMLFGGVLTGLYWRDNFGS